MQPIEIARWAVGAAYAVVLASAAYTDVKGRRIPNWTVLAVMGLFVVWIFVGPAVSVLSALEAAGIGLAVTAALYMAGMLGAGDSKLFTAVALFAGMTYLPHLALATVLAGGVIALGIMVARPTRAMAMLTLRSKGDFGQGIPYGVAIALAGVLIVFGPMLGFVLPFGAGPPITTQDIAKALAGHAIHR